jgi:hypothetical protein
MSRCEEISWWLWGRGVGRGIVAPEIKRKTRTLTPDRIYKSQFLLVSFGTPSKLIIVPSIGTPISSPVLFKPFP